MSRGVNVAVPGCKCKGVNVSGCECGSPMV